MTTAGSGSGGICLHGLAAGFSSRTFGVLLTVESRKFHVQKPQLTGMILLQPLPFLLQGVVLEGELTLSQLQLVVSRRPWDQDLTKRSPLRLLLGILRIAFLSFECELGALL